MFFFHENSINLSLHLTCCFISTALASKVSNTILGQCLWESHSMLCLLCLKVNLSELGLTQRSWNLIVSLPCKRKQWLCCCLLCTTSVTNSTITIAEKSDLAHIETASLIPKDFLVKSPVIERKFLSKKIFFLRITT